MATLAPGAIGHTTCTASGMQDARRFRGALRTCGIGVIGLLGAIQLVPYGREHANPPVVSEPAWDQPATRALAARACFDCHSNETVWPWYSHVAPVSWLVQYDVDEGRRVLNYSEWQRRYEEASESAEEVQEGEMPLGMYVLLHPDAALSPTEKQTLVQGLAATFGEAERESD